MFQKRKINMDTVIVSYEIPEMMIRRSGKTYYGTEEELINIKNDKIIVNADVAKKYGLTIEINSERSN